MNEAIRHLPRATNLADAAKLQARLSSRHLRQIIVVSPCPAPLEEYFIVTETAAQRLYALGLGFEPLWLK